MAMSVWDWCSQMAKQPPFVKFEPPFLRSLILPWHRLCLYIHPSINLSLCKQFISSWYELHYEKTISYAYVEKKCADQLYYITG